MFPTWVNFIVFGYLNDAEALVYAELAPAGSPHHGELKARAQDVTKQSAAHNAVNWAEGLRIILKMRGFVFHDDLLHKASRAGNVETMREIKEAGTENHYCQEYSAALSGNISAMELARSWKDEWVANPGVNLMWIDRYRDNYSDALNGAAAGGHIRAMELARSWGAHDYDSAARYAAEEGHLPAVQRLVSWGANDIEAILVRAAASGKLDLMEFAKNLGASGFDAALGRAADEGRLLAMKQLKDWGATNFDDALYRADRAGQADAVQLLKSWGAKDNSFRKMLHTAGMNAHVLQMMDGLGGLRFEA